jgi:hypothetical protein
MTKYQLVNKRFEHEAGTIVYDFKGYDYGCARDDWMESGIDHNTMTLDPEGGGPFFTVPVTDIVMLHD